MSIRPEQAGRFRGSVQERPKRYQPSDALTGQVDPFGYNLDFRSAAQAKEFLMSLDFPFGRMALALCAGSLFAVTSVIAGEVASQATSGSLAAEKLAARTGPERVVVESAGPYGVDTESVRRHLANTLAADSALTPLPRNNERYSFDGKLRTYVVPVRPAIDNPINSYSPYDSSSFRRDAVAADASNLGLLQAVFKRLAAD
ncbi:hypothetical protein [Variovorax paradoxus]|uniref:hypothetical protein n=1 Tax=Variovorax paradoxus TaxID=34073 RepID=UPI001E301DC3|nr:hypothetical protein [Variovorax paradoxus]